MFKENCVTVFCSKHQLVCCPDDVVRAPVIALTPPIPALVPTLTDFSQLKSHRNMGLINEATCGTSDVNRIVGAVDAEPGEFPWMLVIILTKCRHFDINQRQTFPQGFITVQGSY